MEFDFSGWATRPDVLCSDGRTIMKDAFKHMDGRKVPLIWNHQHEDVNAVLGHALLKSEEGGLYAYCKFNNTESGRTAKELVQHGDVVGLSIFANRLKQKMKDVYHGEVRELSLVLAGANPTALINSVMMHRADSDNDALVYISKEFYMEHGDVDIDENLLEDDEVLEDVLEEGVIDDENKAEGNAEISHSDNNAENKEEKKTETNKDGGETIADVLDTLDEKQQKVVYAIFEALSGEKEKETEKEDGGEKPMKHNVFDQEEMQQGNVLSHADEQAIVSLAKQSGVGTLKAAMEIYAENNEALQHGFEDYEALFPEFELTKKGEPETLERDQSWIAQVMSKIHKSPISRIRTRQADARIAELRAKGYQKKGDEKTVTADIKLLSRTTDPQTVYIKDDMHRDDIIDITDFDVVAHMWKMLRHTMNEELALAALIGDGRDDADPDKIHENHIRSIWNDEELYTIHADVDIAAAKAELQGTNTGANFGDNYVYAEAIITAALYAREKYKGSGNLDFYCTPHLLNVMLLARDLNGRRIYDSKSDLAAALNVNSIHTIEQFEGRTRTDKGGNQKKLLGLFVNLSDYQFGSTKGGEITKFEDFDMDFNKYKYMLETRLSGALTKVYSAIALEEPVVAG